MLLVRRDEIQSMQIVKSETSPNIATLAKGFAVGERRLNEIDIFGIYNTALEHGTPSRHYVCLRAALR